MYEPKTILSGYNLLLTGASFLHPINKTDAIKMTPDIPLYLFIMFVPVRLWLQDKRV